MLTSQAEVPCCCIFSANIAAYFMGCHIRKAPPKQALKVASGSVTPISVPATCAPVSESAVWMLAGCCLTNRGESHGPSHCSADIAADTGNDKSRRVLPSRAGAPKVRFM